ncbi:hypothetical protein LTR67_003914 [Exophiala xenobiotica]
MCFTKEKRCYCPQCSKTIAKTVTDCICPLNEQCLTRNIRPLPVQKKEVPSDQSCRDCASGQGGASSSSRSRSSSSSSTAGRHPSEISGSGGGRYISPPGMSSTSNRIQTLNSDYQPRQSGSSSRQQQRQERSESSRQGEYRSSSSSSSSSRRGEAGAGAEGSARFNGSSSRNGGGSSVDVDFERRPAFDLIERRPGGSSGSTARQGEYVAVSGSGSGSGSGSRSSSSSSSTARQSHSGSSSSSSSSSRQGGDRHGQLVERRPSASSRSSSSRYGGDGTGDEHSYPASSSSSRSRRNAVDYGVNGSVTYTSRTVEVSITYH